MRFSKIGQTILLALSLTAIIIAASCSGADATKPENMKPDFGKELGSGNATASNITLYTLYNNTSNTGKYVNLSSSFFSSLSVSGYKYGTGVTVASISKVTYDNMGTNTDITAIANPIYNDAGGIYRVEFATTDTNITRVNIEYTYKLKIPPAQVQKMPPTITGINTNATNWTRLYLTNLIAGSSTNSLLGKTYVYGISSNINTQPNSYDDGFISSDIIYLITVEPNKVYKLWIY